MPPVQEAIRVMVRIKPPSRFGIERDPSNEKVLNCGDKSFIFDHIFAAQVKDDDVFEKVCYSLIDNALKGYNSTLFVYGQTGTGKTYTMNGNNNDEGIVHRSVKLLRQKIVNDTKIENFSFKMSYIEIYNEKVRDLLSDSFKNVREMAKQGFFVEDLKEIFIESEEDFTKHAKEGNLLRITKPTNMNATSSRSHSILALSLETKQKIDGNIVIKSSKINFVDLAGSQNLNQTGAIGDRKTEARNINLSLQALRKVITALEQKRIKNISHIPYRDSVLTQLLKDSLGGNTSTVIIGTISSDQKYIKETLSTLIFLESAKKIKNVKKINQKLEGNEERLKLTLKSYEENIQKLENQLREAKRQLNQSRQMEEKYVKQIEQLHERILQYDKPRSLFDTLSNMEKQEGFSYFQSQQTMSEDEQINEQLPTVYEEKFEFSFGKDSSKNTFEAKDKTEKDYDIELIKKSKKSNFSETLVNMNTLLYEQIKYLNKKNETFYEESNEYDRLLQLIESNINNLSFDQAQLEIMNLQYIQLQNAKAHIVAVQEHSLKICKMYEEQKMQYEEKFKYLSHKEISDIKEKSQLMSQESKLNRDVDTLQDKIKNLESEIVQIENKYKSQILKLEMEASHLFLERERYSNECLVLEKDKSTLEEANKIQEENFRQSLNKMLEEFTQKKDIQIENISNRCKQQLTSKDEEVKKKNESILKEFLELERENIRLKARIQQISQELSEENEKYSNYVEDYEQLKIVFLQKQTEMKMKIDEGLQYLLEKDQKIKILEGILEQKESEIELVKNSTKFTTIIIDNEQISIENLSFRYQDLKQKQKMLQNLQQNYLKIQKNFSEEIVKKDQKIEELSKYLRELMDSTKILSQQFDEKIKRIEALEGKIKNLKNELSLKNLTIQLEENDRNKILEVQNTHKMYEKQIESLKRKLQEKKEESEKACGQLQKKIDSYYNAYKNQQSKAQKGQKQCRLYQKRVERLESLLQKEKQSNKKVFEKYKRNLEQKQKIIKALYQDMEEKEEKISIQFNEISKKQKIIQQYKKRFQEYQTISIVNEINQKKRQSIKPFRNGNYSME